jgi:hypothetical protein
MEEGKIATAWAQFGATKKSINVYRMRVLPWCYFVDGAGLDQFQLLLVNQPVTLAQNGTFRENKL